jgi:hypothetical protein
MHQRVMLSELTGLWMYIRAVRFIDRGSHRRAIVNVATVEVSIGLPLGGGSRQWRQSVHTSRSETLRLGILGEM